MATACVHKWNIDSSNVGTCSVCGEVRQFPAEKGGKVMVLKEGELKRKRGRPRAIRPVNNDPGESKNDRLPQFPCWCEEWPQIVKVKWLEVYGGLSKIPGKEG